MSAPDKSPGELVAERMPYNANFTLFVRHETTRYVATFKGQGGTLEAAVKDAISNVTTPFRPNSSGVANEHNAVVPRLTVRLPDGRNVNMDREDFEKGKPFTETIEPNPSPKTPEEVALATASDPKRGPHA
jgi:hypothetical protein